MRPVWFNTIFTWGFKHFSECGFPGDSETYEDPEKANNRFLGIENHD